MLRKTLISFTFLWSLVVLAQNDIPTIKIDIEKRTISPTKLPFDTSIKLLITSKKHKLGEYLNVFETKKRKEKKYLIDLDSDASNIKAFQNIKLKARDSGLYTGIIPFVLPNKSYELMFKKKAAKAEFQLFVELCRMKKNNKTDDELKSFYDKSILGLEKSEDPIYNGYFNNDLKANTIGYIGTNWKDFNKPTIGLFSKLLKVFNTTSEQITSDATEIPIAEIQNIGQLVNTYKLDSKTHALLLELVDINLLSQLILGNRLYNERATIDDPYNFIKRKENLDKSLKIIKTIEKHLLRLLAIHSNSAEPKRFIEKYFLPIKREIEKNKTSFDDLYSDFQKLIGSKYDFASLISAESINADIKTTNGQIIVSDFGLINILAFQNDGTTKYIPRPYVGVNFHFGGGINRELKIRNIPSGSRERFWLRSSISLGVTIGKIEEGGFTDFYNGFSPSLGYNYRLDDQIRMGTGILLLRESDKNPFINKNRIEPSLYVNLSFDFNLFTTLGKVAGKLIGI